MHKGVTMKIESSQVNMQTNTESHFEVQRESSMSFLHEVLGYADASDSKNSDKNTIEIVEAPTFSEVKVSEIELTARELMIKLILELILQRFLGGKDLKMYPKEKECALETVEQPSSLKLAVHQKVNIERSVEYSSKQSIDFSTQACVKTADKEIKLDLNLSFSQEFYEKHKESLEFEQISFIDPLVIQFDEKTQAFDMVDEKLTFLFDLNNDDTCEEIPILKDGNGFLVLDENKNGIIDNGSEMFGPSTNDGFAELAQYDQDGNSWIDENDPIFEDLRIWSKNSSGEDELLALGQVGIGALYLTQSEAGFEYKKSVNESLAQLKSNSIYLKEDGSAGVISSLDFIA